MASTIIFNRLNHCARLVGSFRRIGLGWFLAMFGMIPDGPAGTISHSISGALKLKLAAVEPTAL
jgi:hypothetical protein